MIHPEAHAPVRDIPDYEGDPATVYRSLDTLVMPAITIGLDGIRESRKALDAGEAGILAYRFRTIDLSGIDMGEVRDELASLGPGLEPETADWVSVGRALARLTNMGGWGALRKLHALLAGTGAPESGAPLPDACAWHGGEGDGRLSCPECQAEVERHRADERLGRTEQPADWNVVDAGIVHADESGPMFGEAELRRADAYRAGRDEDCGCGLGAGRCRAAEDGDFGG
jgi:hypothetical protein